MELRLNLIIYLLKDKYDIQGKVKKDREIRHFRQFSGSCITHDDTLYILPVSNISKLRELENAKGIYFAILESANLGSDAEQWVSASDDREEPTEIFRLRTNDSSEEIFDYVQNLADDLRQWEREISMALFERSGIEAVANYGKKYLKHEYAVIDQNFNFVYQSTNFQKAVERVIGEDAGTIEGGLIVEKQFHEAAAKKDAFYYYNHNLEFSDLCKNVFINDKYFARVLLQLDNNEKEIHAGEYYLFNIFSEYITRAMQNLIYSDSHHFTDVFHDTCRKLIGNIEMDTASIVNILSIFGWQQEDRYSILKISFYENDNWNVHQKLAVAYIAKSLERKWEHTCAIPFDYYIYWIINETRENVSLDSRAFNQEIKLFLRDNVCNAGVSSSFEGFLSFGIAAVQSEYALKLGRRYHPEQWYYMFGDYRSACVIDMLRESDNADAVIHPALYVLKKYDAKHASELFNTLRAYLECNFNMTKAAEKTNIHRTSFCRRMAQILKLTNLNLEDFEVIFQLMISYKLARKESDF